MNPCKGKPIRADALEEIVWYQVEQTLSNPEMARFGLESVSDEDYEPELINLKARRQHLKHERSRLFDAFRLSVDEATFKVKMKEIEQDEAYIDKRYAEVEGFIQRAIQTPSQDDIKKACDLIAKNTERLDFEGRRRVLEALRVKVHTGRAIRIEGILPIVLQPAVQS